MAIKDPKKSAAPVATLDPAFASEVEETLRLQIMAAQYKDAYEEARKPIIAYLKDDPEAPEITLSKAFPVEIDGEKIGTITMKRLTRFDFDKGALLDMIAKGTLSPATLLEIATVNAEKLKVAIGETAFAKVATASEQQSLELKATPAFKEKVQTAASAVLGLAVPAKPAKAPTAPPAASGDVQADLDSILGGK